MICTAQRDQTVRIDGSHFLRYNYAPDTPADDEPDPNGDAARFYYLHENATQVVFLFLFLFDFDLFCFFFYITKKRREIFLLFPKFFEKKIGFFFVVFLEQT